jgi:hypothetical protein
MVAKEDVGWSKEERKEANEADDGERAHSPCIIVRSAAMVL